MRGLSHAGLVITLCCIIVSLWGQRNTDLTFVRIGKETGLSHNSIRHLIQDQTGFLWIGTEDGLNRFDGNKMVVFKQDTDDPYSLSSNFIEHISIDNKGNLWVSTVQGLNKLDPTTGQFERFLHDPDNPSTLPFPQVLTSLPDDDGFLWLGGTQLARLDPESGQFLSWSLNAENRPIEGDGIEHIAHLDEDRLLAAGSQGLFVFHKKEHTFNQIQLPNRPGAQNPRVISVYVDRQDRIWATGVNHIFQLNQQLEVEQQYTHDPADPYSVSDHDLPMILEDKAGYIWFGSFAQGLNRLNLETGQFQHYQYQPDNEQSLSNNIIWSLCQDFQGNLWVGTNNGLNRVNSGFDRIDNGNRRTGFEMIDNRTEGAIRSVLEDKLGFLWVGTDGGGLSCIDRSSGEVTVHRHQPSNSNRIPSDRLRAMLEDRERNLWIGSFNGLSVLPATGRAKTASQLNTIKWVNFEDAGTGYPVLKVGPVRALAEAKNGNIWIGSFQSGVHHWDKIKSEFTSYLHDPKDPNSLSSDEILTLHEDQSGQLWIGTFGGGLNRLDPKTGAITHYRHETGTPTSLSDDFVWSIHEDAQGDLWIGTQGGLNVMRKGRPDEFEHYQEEDGLPNNVIYGIQGDRQGRLWLSTNKGLACFDPKTGRCFNYDQRDGLQADEFNPNAAARSPRSGHMYFGGPNGLNTFNPLAFQLDIFAPRAIITALTRYREAEQQNERIVQYFQPSDRQFTFNHRDNIISFEVAMLNYQQTYKNKFEYRLQGFQKSWFPLEEDGKITFTNLPAGHYSLQLRGANHHGIWQESPTEYAIQIRPPWWKSHLAKVIYFLLAVAIIMTFYRYQLNKQLAEREAQELRKLDELKTNFFTNISHEFRTPLTMILGPAQRSLKSLSKNRVAEAIGDHQLILQNGKRLLKLINEILDINKLEAGKLTPRYVQIPVVELTRRQVSAFDALAEAEGISINFEAEVTELLMDTDVEMLEKILSNLLSNAIKYTPPKGTIHIGLRQGEQQLEITVQDSGAGIPTDQLQYVFDRFYQVKRPGKTSPSGTGIGLSLSKELVELLGGEISVESQVNKGTSFRVVLPIKHTAPQQPLPGETIEISTPAEQPASTPVPAFNPLAPEDELQILVIEDNTDMADYIASCLSTKFNIEFALNGREGLEKALETIPDLIVTDVMMPEMDGVEVCKHLKTDERTSHIPVIMLTARAGVETKLEGLRVGADAYLSKPFNEEELQVRVDQLLALREKLRTRWQQNELSSEVAPEDNSIEDQFVSRTQDIIMHHLQNPNFEIEQLARELGLSESQLRRKLSALTGMSPVRFMRSLRIQRAQELLVSTEMNVAEIAYETGFSDPKYFSRVFSRAVGRSPSEYRKEGDAGT